jgi:hypothetical protein
MPPRQLCVFGADHNAGPGTTSVCSAFRRHLGNRFTGQRFEFFTHSIDASAQVLHLRAAALRAKHGPNRVASQTHKRTILALDDSGSTLLAGCNFTARNTGRKARAPFAIQNAHDASIATKRLDESLAKET